METDRILKILRPFSNVFQDYLIEIEPPAAEQSKNVGRSVLPRTMDLPVPIGLAQLAADSLQYLAGGFLRESNELAKYPHLAHLV